MGKSTKTIFYRKVGLVEQFFRSSPTEQTQVLKWYTDKFNDLHAFMNDIFENFEIFFSTWIFRLCKIFRLFICTSSLFSLSNSFSLVIGPRGFFKLTNFLIAVREQIQPGDVILKKNYAAFLEIFVEKRFRIFLENTILGQASF